MMVDPKLVADIDLLFAVADELELEELLRRHVPVERWYLVDRLVEQFRRIDVALEWIDEELDADGVYAVSGGADDVAG